MLNASTSDQSSNQQTNFGNLCSTLELVSFVYIFLNLTVVFQVWCWVFPEFYTSLLLYMCMHFEMHTHIHAFIRVVTYPVSKVIKGMFE